LVESYKASPAEGAQAARDAAIGAIRDPVTLFPHQRNLLQQPAVIALEKKDAKLFGLLKVFQEGKISDYQEYVKSQGGEAALLKSFGLEAERCQRHMRILSLCSLAQEYEEIPYSVVAATLQLSGGNAEVETWVIAAVGSGLLEAKMDQLQEKIMVERCVVRKFDMEQWKALQARLQSWKQNVGGILAALKQAGSTAAVS
jgi:translation initiation factor 3 subunit M